MTLIAQTKIGEWQTVSGQIVSFKAHRSWVAKKHLSELIIDDKTGRLCCVWFNQPYLERYFRLGERIVVYGKTAMYKNRLQMISPEYEMIGNQEDEYLSLGRLVPIYPLTRGITQRYLRKIIKNCIDRYQDELNDTLSVSLRNKHRLYNIKRSLSQIHFPDTLEDKEEALKRISFEEFYFFQISVILRRMSIIDKPGIAHNISDAFTLKFTHSFPFELTGAQRKVIQEIQRDMKQPIPMLRLLQGDVGSGKTLVALFGCIAASQNGFQSCIMAPTEILARQHYENIRQMIRAGSLEPLNVGLLVSNLKGQEKLKVYEQIKNGKLNVVIGTHALIEESVQFKNLSFVVIDEQHKFGVRQRALLTKKGINPDILIMTATPIPRSLCMTLYGDLDTSVIDELPPGRGKIKTLLFKEEEAFKVYEIVKENLKKRRQAYIVYPIIEESEKLDLKAAQEMFHRFKAKEFKEYKISLIHGQMKKKEADEVMEKFKRKETDLLIATTVIEVGMDIPNANVMVVEHADRFGLAQLHQLRGRIGRGKEEAVCILVASVEAIKDNLRLKAILATQDGFKIAEQDLLIRGPGQFFGRHQHGLNELKIANPVKQVEILELARKEAIALIEQDPKLEKGKNPQIKKIVKKRYPAYLSMVTAG